MTNPVTRLDVRTMPQEYTRKFNVTLNGVKQRHCIVADAKDGYVVRYRMGLYGAPVLGRDGNFKTQQCWGVVAITEKTDGC